jgi:DNA-binding transcriptional regulator YiaG
MGIIERVRAVDAAVPLETLPAPSERRAIRERAGVTLQVAATGVGVNVNTFLDWERGLHQPRVSAEYRYRKLLAACSQASGKVDA